MSVPFIAAQAALGLASAGAGAAQTIAANKAGKRAREANQDALDDLLKRRDAGALGLTPNQRRLQEQTLMTPVRTTAGEQRQRMEAAAAAAGGRSAGDIARIGDRQQEIVARGGQAAASQILQNQIAARQAQEHEIEARYDAEKQMQLEKTGRTFGALEQGASALGALAGAVPEALRAAGPMGGAAGVPADQDALAANLKAAGIDDKTARRMISLERKQPGILDEILQGLQAAQPASTGPTRDIDEIGDIATELARANAAEFGTAPFLSPEDQTYINNLVNAAVGG